MPEQFLRQARLFESRLRLLGVEDRVRSVTVGTVRPAEYLGLLRPVTRHRERRRRPDTRSHPASGHDYLHVAIDDASRVAYVAVRPDELAESTITFVQEAVRFFADQGVQVERVMTDNAWTYVRSIRPATLFAGLGIRHIRTRPRRPQTNGKDVHLCQAASSARSALNRVPALSIAQRTRSFVRARAMIAWWWDLPSARLRS